jgi:aminoglycoside phosphotransferase (APT) family kinase protein
MSDIAIDQAIPLAEGVDAFDALRVYLNQRLNIGADSILVNRFPSGYSNLTYLIQLAGKEFVMRRPPVGANIRTAHDMGREFKVLSMLRPVYPHVPEPVLYCDDESVIGAPFYVMERVRGVILRNKVPEATELTPALMRKISETTVDHLASLHELKLDSGLSTLGKPEGYILRQVDGWIQRYTNSETDPVPDMRFTAEWLRENMPVYDKPAFIHNDFKYDNLVLDPEDLTRILAVLDWEMATVGDPLMDLGTSLGYWAEANDPVTLKYNLTWLPGNLSREEVAERYARKTGRDVSQMLFYYTFGLFKIGVIVQQIYARYKKGLTQDARFAGLIHTLTACAANAKTAITLKRISHLY